MTTALTPQERRWQNRVRHLQARQEANRARGPKGEAASWWDYARAIATRAERDGDPELWNHLARTLANWCQQTEQAHPDQHGQ
ncbi:hypothetical protein ACH46L_31715 [Streptomyces althioticus]|uniref:hypothetical protein n=1 Tax=Streptomyces althioticus TaxID=83380 RepID=UPI0037ABE632